jgi:hypothetical protein
MAEDLEESDYKKLLKMSCNISVTKTSSSSSSLNNLLSCNVTLAEPISNTLPEVMESAVSDAIILPIRIVSGIKPPEPFIKIAPSKPLISTESKQAVTSAITLEDLRLWSQIAKENDQKPQIVSSNVSSASAGSSVANGRVGVDLEVISTIKDNESHRLRPPEEFF